MLFQFNTDNQLDADGATEQRVREAVEGRLRHVADRLTRVEVHVSEVNGPRGGPDKQCSVELRPKGMEPVAGTDLAETVERAAASAADKAVTAFERRVGRATDRKGH